jgi:putative Mn2+ efflux pump MntP
MTFLPLLLIAIGLAMDSVTVSISCGLILYKFNFRNTLRISLFMGFFQGLMPMIGWFLGSSFRIYIESFDHWVAFIILLFLGSRMIYQQITTKDDFKCFDPTSNKVLLGLAVATSIDALAVGITFSLINISMIYAVSIIGLTSFFLSFLAVYLGSKFKQKMKIPFELVGGIILILIGLKILVEHLSS